MLVSRFNPWNDLLSLQGQTERLFNEAFGQTVVPVQALPLDIRQTQDAFYIEASVPGFRPEDVEVTVDENVLLIRGIRPPDDQAVRGSYVQRERQLSSVHRHVHLPVRVKAEEITASFDNGILTIMVPREQKAEPKRISVTMARVEEPKVIEAPVGAGSVAG